MACNRAAQGDPRFKEGDIVRHGAGMQERFVSDGQGMQVLKPDPAAFADSVYMHATVSAAAGTHRLRSGLLETGALKAAEHRSTSPPPACRATTLRP